MAAITPPRNMKTFFVIWLGQVISVIGSGLTSFALGVWIFDRTGQATPFALTALFGTLPRIFLAPVAGALVDRWNRRWIMILADTANAAVTMAAVILLFSGQLAVWHIYLLSAIGAVCSAFQEPAYSASITMLVPKKNLARASGMVQMMQATSLLISPFLAGILYGLIGLQGIFLLDFITYFFAVGALLVVTIPQPPVSVEEIVSTGDGKGRLLRDVLYGWNYLKARTGLLLLLLYFALTNFLLNIASVLTGPLVLSFGSPQQLGLVQMVTGLGMLAGSVVMSTWGGPQRRIRGVVVFIVVAALGMAGVGLQPQVLLIAAGFFVFLFAIPLASGLSQAIFQSKVEPAVQGRVFSTRSMISQSAMPLAFLLAGPLSDRVFEPLMQPGGFLAKTFLGSLIGVGPGRGTALIFIFSGLILVLASLLAYAHPRIRKLEDELPDVIAEEADAAFVPTEA